MKLAALAALEIGLEICFFFSFCMLVLSLKTEPTGGSCRTYGLRVAASFNLRFERLSNTDAFTIEEGGRTFSCPTRS